MVDYIKVGKWVINPKYITSVHDFQDDDDESEPHIAIRISGDDHSIELHGEEATAFLLWIVAASQDIAPV
jgi:hypothetical protein